MTENEDVAKKPDKEPLDDEALEKLAVEELMREAVQGAARAEVLGPSGWIKVPPQKTNKRFLVNTIRHAVSSNKYHQSSRSNSKHSNTKIFNRRDSDKHLVPIIKKDRLIKKH